MTAPLVLLCDDDPDCLEISRQVLEAAGYRVRCSHAPAEALAAAAAERPDLVVTDLVMDRLDDGFALAQRLRADKALCGLPVIVLTGVSGALGLDFRPRADGDLAAMGVDAFLEKPVRAETLRREVARLLGR